MAWAKILFGLLVSLILYAAFVLRPQITELKRKMNLSEFQGTEHLKTMQFSLRRLEGRFHRLRWLILAVGLLTLGWIPW